MKISDYVESQIKGLWGTNFDENGIPVIKTNNLTYEGNIDYSDICKRNITKEQAKECYLKLGDLLLIVFFRRNAKMKLLQTNLFSSPSK